MKAIACSDIPEGAWCPAGARDCVDNSKTYCHGFANGGMWPLTCPDGSSHLCKGPNRDACLASNCAKQIKCANVPAGSAWCFPGHADCVDNSRTYCTSFDQGGLDVVSCPESGARVCKGPSKAACCVSAGDTWASTEGLAPSWGVPREEPLTARQIIQDLCHHKMGGSKAQQKLCAHIAMHGPSSVEGASGDAAIFGGLAAAMIFGQQA